MTNKWIIHDKPNRSEYWNLKENFLVAPGKEGTE